jgi:hypothetical protein
MRTHSVTTRVVARRDGALSARVVRTAALQYADVAHAQLDRPPHVRAGSGLAWVGDRLVVVQDDANFFALVDPLNARTDSVTLPVGAGGRRRFEPALGNKAHKLDLESVVSIPQAEGGPLVLSLGSGSTARRESIIVMRGLDDPRAGSRAVIAAHALPALYARLRETVAFAGSELNVEAAVHLGSIDGGRLRLFNRGNGARRGNFMPVNASGEMDWRDLEAYMARPDLVGAPQLGNLVQYELGAVGGLPLTFTDAAVVPGPPDAERRWTVYTAAAEASPDATRDGPVAGCAVGVISEGPEGISARWALLEDEAGQPFAGKVEGVELRPDDSTRLYAVVDRDAPEVASELCEVALQGPWFSES